MPVEDRSTDILLLDYEATREDERTFLTIQATLFSLALASLSILAVVVSNDCRFPGQDLAKDCTDRGQTPDAVLAAVPLIPLALISYLQIIGSAATLRSFYMRALERELRSRVQAQKRRISTYQGLRLTSYTEVLLSVQSAGRSVGTIRLLSNVLILSLVVVLGGATILIATAVSLPWQLIMLLIYGGGAVAIFLETMRSLVHGRRSFSVAVESAARRAAEPLELNIASETGKRRGRSLGSYLLLPRPDDLVKSAIFPASFFLAVLSGHALPPKLGSEATTAAVALWLSLELLIYQARYQWNDIAGLEADVEHPQASARGRLPLGSNPISAKRAIRLSLAVAGLRLYVALIVGSVASLRLALPLLVLAICIYALAALYEGLRRVGYAEDSYTSVAWGIYVLVGAGYAVRGLAGFWAATTLDWDLNAGEKVQSGPAVWLALAGFMTLYGCVFVLLTWFLDACGYCIDRLPRQAGPVRWVQGLLRKPHYFLLLTSGGIALERIPTPVAGVVRSLSGASSRYLRDGDRTLSVHLLFTVFAGAASGLLGGVLCATAGPALALLGAVGALAGLGLSLGGQEFRLWIAAAGLCLLWFTQQAETLARDRVLTVLPWAVLSMTVLAFRSQSLNSLKRGWKVPVACGTYAVWWSLLRSLGPSASRMLGVRWRGSRLSAGQLAIRRLILPAD